MPAVKNLPVKKILSKTTTDRRADVDKIFALGNLYEKKEKPDRAVKYYNEGLKVDGWRLEYQIKLAELLEKQDHTKEALERAEFVYQYAEDENLTQQAENLLGRHSRKPKSKLVNSPDEFLCYRSNHRAGDAPRIKSFRRSL